MNAEPAVNQRERQLQRRREQERARCQSESAEQLRGVTKMEKTELDMLLRLLNKGSLSLQRRHDLLNAESA